MENQNFNNHSRFVPLYHYVLFGICLASFVLAIIHLINSLNILSVLVLLITISILLIFFLMRSFPLRVQDRAIRAEENLRYFSMTGKLLKKELTMSQIIALRFAGDSEFVELVDQAIQNNWTNKEIKQAIKNWRADNHRA